jgi:hypothetical protein
MAVKGFVQEGLAAGEIIVLISLDVKGAFDAAWWPSILNGLKAYNCPKNLYNLSRSYFSQQSAVLSSTNASIQRTVTKGSTRILLRARVLEHPIKFPTEHSIHEKF